MWARVRSSRVRRAPQAAEAGVAAGNSDSSSGPSLTTPKDNNNKIVAEVTPGTPATTTVMSVVYATATPSDAGAAVVSYSTAGPVIETATPSAAAAAAAILNAQSEPGQSISTVATRDESLPSSLVVDTAAAPDAPAATQSSAILASVITAPAASVTGDGSGIATAQGSPLPNTIVTASPTAASATRTSRTTSRTATPTASSSSSSSKSSSSTTMTTGAKAGIAVGVILLAGAVLSIILFCVRKRKSKAKKQQRRQMKQQPQQQPDDEKNPFTNAAAITRTPSTRTTKHAPRLSLRPVTQFLPYGNSAEKRVSNGIQLAETNPQEQNKNNPFGAHAETSQATAPVTREAPSKPTLTVPQPTVTFKPASNSAAAAAAASIGASSLLRGARRESIKAHLSPPSPTNTDYSDVTDTGFSTPSTSGAAIAAAGGPANSSVHRVQLDFKPSMDDELELQAGQLVRLLHEYDDGWAMCIRLDRSQQGVVPRTCLSTRPVKARPTTPRGQSGNARAPAPQANPFAMPYDSAAGNNKGLPTAPLSIMDRSMSPAPLRPTAPADRPVSPLERPKTPPMTTTTTVASRSMTTAVSTSPKNYLGSLNLEIPHHGLHDEDVSPVSAQSSHPDLHAAARRGLPGQAL